MISIFNALHVNNLHFLINLSKNIDLSQVFPCLWTVKNTKMITMSIAKICKYLHVLLINSQKYEFRT